jgi:hypothetical protein
MSFWEIKGAAERNTIGAKKPKVGLLECVKVNGFIS